VFRSGPACVSQAFIGSFEGVRLGADSSVAHGAPLSIVS
jgi:hypothetical protein